jgi:uncharacterized protein YecT (DUF1311 family)
MRAGVSIPCLPAACLAALLLAAAAQVPARAFSPEGVECIDRAGDVAQRMACAETELKAQTKALAAMVQRLKAAGDGRAGDLLAKTQAAWEAHRDAHCAWMADRLRRDAAVQRLEHLLCLAGATESRVQELEDYANVP